MHQIFIEWHKKRNFNQIINSFFKIQKLQFLFKKKTIFRSIFNENTDLFCDQKKFQNCI